MMVKIKTKKLIYCYQELTNLKNNLQTKQLKLNREIMKLKILRIILIN